ncbi:hypothetical protein B1748_02115 [Paenibacillus sp. MY03]|uniref:alpha-galactosidase n=1 Tax=Paenibacillus sp. MY03 TaxID=302980 RepID=UPI000B3C8DCB|nr:alpha-galactosidase [Paenibacillus sp. MY03]OUS78413.1 hypothetical protein B1748_02115 [Paenibacillus sp. MY03]
MITRSSILKNNRIILLLFTLPFMLYLIMYEAKTAYASTSTSGDAYVTYDSGTRTWTLGTDDVEKKVRLNDLGQFMQTSFKNKLTNREYVQGTQQSDEFQIKIGSTVYNGSSTGWIYDTHDVTTLSQGELQLKITFHNSVVKVHRYYVVFPDTGAIREWSEFQNVSGSPQSFSSPYMFKQRLMQNDRADIDLQYMTGGGNFTGSGVLKTVSMTGSYNRTFDSYDAPEVMMVDGHYQNAIGTYEQGTSVYDAFFVLRNRSLSEGIWLSFDFNGHWLAQVSETGTPINLSGYVSMADYLVADNASITGAKSIIGVFSGDLDDMGNTILDYSYRYLWDYTRGSGGGSWQNRISPQMPSAWESTNYARYAGGTVVHVDDNWYDRKGDWNEALADESFADLNEYVQKSGIKMRVWSPFWHVDYGSEVVKNHPEWLVEDDEMTFYGLHLNLANEDAYDWIVDKATSKQTEWGAYDWRYDGAPAWKSGGSDNDMLAQSHNFFRLLKEFKDANPYATIQGCASGGEILSMEALRYVDAQQLTDGLAYHYAGYYQSLKIPLVKLGHGFYSEPDIDADFTTLEPKSAATKEKYREFVEMQRYIGTQGVNGRWSKVFRPTMAFGDETYMLQTTNGDQTKAMIMFNGSAPYFNTNLTVYPKGLLDATDYTLSCPKGSCTSQTRTGAYWKSNGVALTNLQAGEMIFFNMTDYPGSGVDTIDPSAPSYATVQKAEYMGHYGAELNWSPASDDRFLSYYEIERNGTVIDKVSIGTFYFLENADSGDVYRIRSVDGDGNASTFVTAALLSGGPTPPAPPIIASRYEFAADFSSSQGANQWAYQQQYNPFPGYNYLTNLFWDASNNRWKGNDAYPMAAPGWVHPGDEYNPVIKWIAPKDGTVRVSGTVSLSQAGQGGDGIVARIQGPTNSPYTNGDIWGPHTLGGNDTVGISHDLIIEVKRGQVIFFIVNKNGNEYFDGTHWNPVVTYGSFHSASAGFSSTQGDGGWYYQQWDGSTYYNLPTYDAGSAAWQQSGTDLIIGAAFQHPDTNESVRKWVAPSSGTIDVTGTVKMYQSGGDGVVVTIKKNGTTLWGPHLIDGNDTTTGVSHHVTTTVTAGDAIFFIVNKNGSKYFDSTLWDPMISLYP